MRNRDQLQDFQLRADLLPKEIELLCEHLFSTIALEYLESASMAIQIVRAAGDHYKHLSNSKKEPKTTLCLGTSASHR